VTASAAAADWTVVVLTGGRSRRMGRDKATLEVAGQTLLARTVEQVPPEVPLVVAGPQVTLDRSGVTFVQEEPPGGGPVAGLDAALAAVFTPIVVVLATDLPFAGRLPAELARSLRGSPQDTHAVLAAGPDGRPQQLCAAYRADALRDAVVANGPAAGAAMHRVVERLRTSTIGALAVDDGADATWDIDTPEDALRLAELLARSPEED
jgi:molybdopterin-guanine dinucleotide biosynthesis protein A